MKRGLLACALIVTTLFAVAALADAILAPQSRHGPTWLPFMLAYFYWKDAWLLLFLVVSLCSIAGVCRWRQWWVWTLAGFILGAIEPLVQLVAVIGGGGGVGSAWWFAIMSEPEVMRKTSLEIFAWTSAAWVFCRTAVWGDRKPQTAPLN